MIVKYDLLSDLRSAERICPKKHYENLSGQRPTGNPEERARARKLVTSNTAINLNFGKWVMIATSEYPLWSVVEKCKLWVSEKWRPFRIALSKPLVVPKLDSSTDKLAVPTLNSMGASPSITETAEVSDAHKAMGSDGDLLVDGE